MIPKRYIVNAAQHSGGPIFNTLKAARSHVRDCIKQDMIDCRRKFGKAFLEVFEDRVFEIRAGKQKEMPMWMRYTISRIL